MTDFLCIYTHFTFRHNFAIIVTLTFRCFIFAHNLRVCVVLEARDSLLYECKSITIDHVCIFTVSCLCRWGSHMFEACLRV